MKGLEEVTWGRSLSGFGFKNNKDAWATIQVPYELAKVQVTFVKHGVLPYGQGQRFVCHLVLSFALLRQWTLEAYVSVHVAIFFTDAKLLLEKLDFLIEVSEWMRCPWSDCLGQVCWVPASMLYHALFIACSSA
ncbi:hypothetical protein HPP92_011710 [Vanilla planifolia]|uniref:Uncharacterized protein n=1 Tax=Vanilla planifolia TaxID=51239 RepID=A0A835V5A0_VANPL|nr:hypothetical protein HPP92_011710 [Vanilla planifolia]